MDVLITRLRTPSKTMRMYFKSDYGDSNLTTLFSSKFPLVNCWLSAPSPPNHASSLQRLIVVIPRDNNIWDNASKL